MIVLSDQELVVHSNLYNESFGKSSGAPLMWEQFVKKTMKQLRSEYNRGYPYTVKIPKSVNKLTAGDFKPEYEIVVNEPIMGEYGEMWFGDTLKGTYLLPGYVHGDSRNPCLQKLGDDGVHGLLVGSTGQGKSVTLNSMIMSMCTLYPPWELHLTMSDAKVVEFKQYALHFPLPHIRTIAATADSEYVVSALEDLSFEMQAMYNSFSKSNVLKIEDFRKATGLCIPQNIIIIDEFQMMFKYASNNNGVKTRLQSAIDTFVRLGRATGYHLLMASQELGDNISKEMLSNMTVRCAMGCTPNVSNLVLGNEEAKNNLGKKGRMLLNANAGTENAAGNIPVRVPLILSDTMRKHGGFLIKHAEKMGYQSQLAFYDETERVTESRYSSYLERFSYNPNEVCLGEPVFVTHEKDQVVKLHLDGDTSNNICVLSMVTDNLRRCFVMLKKNIERYGSEVSNIAINADGMYQACGISELAGNLLYESKNYHSDGFSVARSVVNRRGMCLDIDNKVFSNPTHTPETDKLFYEYLQVDGALDTELNKSRFYYAYMFLNNNAVTMTAFGVNVTDPEMREERIKSSINGIFSMYRKYGGLGKRVVKASLPVVYIWILGTQKIVGFGRDTKPANVNEMKKSMMDAVNVNVRFILFSSVFEELTDLRACFRYFICDQIEKKDAARIGASDVFPDAVSQNLGVVFDTTGSNMNKIFKYKKMAFDDEI